MLALALALSGALATSAPAALPYGGASHRLAAGVVPNDLGDNDWKYAATAEPGSPNTADPKELNGVRGAHVVDADKTAATAWQTTTGRTDVAIAVLDSGIKWNDFSAMWDLRKKVRLNAHELPVPRHDRGAPTDPDAPACAAYTHAGHDANGDGIFNVLDYACDSRVSPSPAHGVGPSFPPTWPNKAFAGKPLLDPQDVVIRFSDGTDADRNGFVDDIAGWDFLDNDNDPFDDVQYGHGTGEALDSTAEADNAVKYPRPGDPSQTDTAGGDAGSCPNCMVVPLRVGDSFIADVNRFAQAAIYATDNGVDVIQEALGTLNKSRIARQAIDYAYGHGVAIIASAADEAAQHHNWPSAYPHVIVVNSVNRYDAELTTPTPLPPANRSYLQLNGCTNFMSKITVAIPSSSCSSNATGLGAGLAGLIYSAALDARGAGSLSALPAAYCRRADGSGCGISANEVRQLMASGDIAGRPQADDVDFVPPGAELSCPAPNCTDPNALGPVAAAFRPLLSPIATTRSYPARKGFDEFYGYGRVNEQNAVSAVAAGVVPPEAEITAPEWYDLVDPARGSLPVSGAVAAPRAPGGAYKCTLLVAPGTQPNNATTADGGDFKPVGGGWCDGTTTHSGAYAGPLGTVDLNALASRFPPTVPSRFDGREQDIGPPNFNGRPNAEPYSFTVKVVVSATESGKAVTGEDRRQLALHHDADLLPGFPRQLAGDGEASPLFVDLDGDNRNELVVANSDGVIHAFRSDGSEARGWPVHGDRLPLHLGGRAFRTGAVSRNAYGAFLASPAAADLDGDGVPEVVGADLEGRVYVFGADGRLRWKREARVAFSGKPLRPFVNSRRGELNRTQHGFIGAPVVADLDGDGRPEVIAAGMDRHVYAWHAGGTPVKGFPVLVVDPDKVQSIDPVTDQVTFKPDAGGELQGAIIDTPAVADITGDGKPEIVVGTNEEYQAAHDGGFNAGLSPATLSAIGKLEQAANAFNQSTGLANVNGRVYAIKATGDAGGQRDPRLGKPFAAGWPVKVGLLQAHLLPVVGEGVTGYPVVGPVSCPVGGAGDKVGVLGNTGPAYVFNGDGSSCYGNAGAGRDNALDTDFAASPTKHDTPAIPAVGHPAFGDFGDGVSLLAPAAGLIRALDVAANEYQGGQDFLAAWNLQTGRFRPGWPAPVNDLQFITGPSVGDVTGAGGQQAVEGTASLDLEAFDGNGQPASDRWPRLTGDWTVANPLIGTFGTLDTSSGARKVVVALTRSGRVLAYRTPAPACPASGRDSWPRFHHDNANSGDYSRDAVAPGRPTRLSVSGRTLSFVSPGDDLMCGTPKRYVVVQSDHPIAGADVARLPAVPGAPAPVAAGARATMTLPAGVKRFVGVRAADAAGNVGRVAVVDLGR